MRDVYIENDTPCHTNTIARIRSYARTDHIKIRPKNLWFRKNYIASQLSQLAKVYYYQNK